MKYKQNKIPTVFIHYSWDDEDHKKWVLKLANRLVQDGVIVLLDQYDLRIGTNFTYFMSKIESADKVLLIMTEPYKLRVDSLEGGAGFEYQLITNEILKNLKDNTKFLPILKHGSKEISVPLILQSYVFLDMRDESLFAAKYLDLLRDLYEEPVIKKPTLGSRPNFEILSVEEYENEGIASVFSLGISRDKIHKILGPPQSSEDSFFEDTFWAHGISVFYNKHTGLSDGVLIKQLPSGVLYEGKLWEIQLGDTFAQVKAKLGIPVNWALSEKYVSYAVYKMDNHYLIVVIWRKAPDKSGEFKVGTVCAIGYCQECSVLACQPMVAITIEEIRAKKPLSYLESNNFEISKSIVEVDLYADYFHEPYEIVEVETGLFGGFIVYVIFTKSKKQVNFWLYDVAHVSLMVRMIIDPAKLPKIEEN